MLGARWPAMPAPSAAGLPCPHPPPCPDTVQTLPTNAIPRSTPLDPAARLATGESTTPPAAATAETQAFLPDLHRDEAARVREAVPVDPSRGPFAYNATPTLCGGFGSNTSTCSRSGCQSHWPFSRCGFEVSPQGSHVNHGQGRDCACFSCRNTIGCSQAMRISLMNEAGHGMDVWTLPDTSVKNMVSRYPNLSGTNYEVWSQGLMVPLDVPLFDVWRDSGLIGRGERGDLVKVLALQILPRGRPRPGQGQRHNSPTRREPGDGLHLRGGWIRGPLHSDQPEATGAAAPVSFAASTASASWRWFTWLPSQANRGEETAQCGSSPETDAGRTRSQTSISNPRSME